MRFVCSGRGVTLVELVVTMAVMAILAAIAVPSFQGLQKRNQVDATMHLLTSHLASARVTAITHNVPVIVCPSTGNGLCRTDNDWGEYWLSFRDPDGNRQPDEDIDIYRNDTAPRSARLRIVSSAGRHYVRYQSNGFSYGTNLTVRVCYDGKTAGSVIVNNTGRARSARSSGSAPCGG